MTPPRYPLTVSLLLGYGLLILVVALVWTVQHLGLLWALLWRLVVGN